MSGNAASLVNLSVPATLVAGASFPATFVFTNTGTTTWICDAQGGLYRLGSNSPDDNTTWGTDRIVLPNNVAPGAQVTITTTLTAPAAGIYAFTWQMLQESVERFGDVATQSITVSNAPIVPSWGTPPGPRTDPNDLIGWEIGIGPYQTDSGYVLYSAVWVNNTGKTLRVVLSRIWSGVSSDANAVPPPVDSNCIVMRTSDGTSLGALTWDRYALPSQPVENVTAFPAGYYVAISPGDGITLQWRGQNDLNNTPPPLVQHLIWLWAAYASGLEIAGGGQADIDAIVDNRT